MNKDRTADELEALLRDLRNESSAFLSRESVVGGLLLIIGIVLMISGSNNVGAPSFLLGGFFLGSWDGKRTSNRKLRGRIEDMLLNDDG